MTNESPPTAARTDRKAVLFCLACGHEALYDGAWSVNRVAGDRTDVECPDCGELVIS